jgi:hypothetical protein
MSTFKDWHEAHAYAEAQVRTIGIAHGIEKMPDHFSRTKGAVVFSVKMLPLKKNRQGWELRCEAIEPEDVRVQS